MYHIRKYLLFIGIGAGALGGYLYYYFIGCAGGTCPITSNPFISTIYGGMMGGLLFGMFRKEKSLPGSKASTMKKNNNNFGRQDS